MVLNGYTQTQLGDVDQSGGLTPGGSHVYNGDLINTYSENTKDLLTQCVEFQEIFYNPT